MNRLRVVVVANSPFPYTTPIFNALDDLVDLDVIYMAQADPRYGLADVWGERPGFRYVARSSHGVWMRRADFRVQIAAGVSRTLSRLKPDVVVVTSWGPLTFEPMLWKQVTKRRSVMWSESTPSSGRFRDPVSQTVRRTMVRLADAYVANGSLAADYLVQLGARRDRLVVGCLPAPRRTVPPASTHDGVGFLFVGRLVEPKHPTMVVEAFSAVLGVQPNAKLTIVGDGPLYPEVARAASAMGDRVRISGHLEGADLALAYAEADVLVMPAEHEVWGLVVNEGLAAGLFVIASDQVGSAHDLLDPRSGRMVAGRNAVGLATAMVDVAQTLDRSTDAVSYRRGRVADCTPAAFASNIAKAAELAVRR